MTPEFFGHPAIAGLIALLNGVILILIGWVGVSVRAIFQQLRNMNGRLGKMEEWGRGHEKLDDERHETNEKEHGSLRSAVEYVMRQTHELFGKLKE